MRPEVHDTPPASPQLSDTTSLPATESDLANLSDVSGLSDDEDKHASDISESDFGPDDDEDFTNISRSMDESTFVDVAGDLAASSGDGAAPTIAESPGFNANKETKGSRYGSRDRTPSASISLTRSSIRRKAANQMPPGFELRYPDPTSDGLSPFRSQASLDDSFASDTTVAATASAQPDEGSEMSHLGWELEDAATSESDKSALVTSLISCADTEVLVEATQQQARDLDSMDPFMLTSELATKEAPPSDASDISPLSNRRTSPRYSGVLACGVVTIAVALAVYQGQGGQISIFPSKAAFPIRRTDLIIYPNSSTVNNESMTLTHPPVVDIASASSSGQAVTAAAVRMPPISTDSVKSERHIALSGKPSSTSSAVTSSHSAITDPAASARATMPEGTKNNAILHSEMAKGKDGRKGAAAPVAGPSYAHAISALSLYNERIRSLSLSRYVPHYALHALKPSIFNKTKHTKQKRRARQIRRRLAKRARQSYLVLNGDTLLIDAENSVCSRRSRKQQKKEEIASRGPRPETVPGRTESQATSPEPICTCKCSQDESMPSSSHSNELDSDELFLSPIRTPKRVLESMNYLTFVKWIEQVVEAHFTNIASYLSIDPATSKHLKRELHRRVDPMVSLGWRCRTLPAHAKHAILREIHTWKKEANVAAKRIKQGSRKSASKARRNARTIIKRVYRK
jgi:hypothetical protein